MRHSLTVLRGGLRVPVMAAAIMGFVVSSSPGAFAGGLEEGLVAQPWAYDDGSSRTSRSAASSEESTVRATTSGRSASSGTRPEEVETSSPRVVRSGFFDRSEGAAGISGAASLSGLLDQIYLFGSLGLVTYDFTQSDVSSSEDITPDESDVAFRGGLGYILSDAISVETSIANLGSPAEIKELAGVVDSKIDFEFVDVIEVAAVVGFNVPRIGVRPTLRVGGFAFDGFRKDEMSVTFGLGLQRGNLRAEFQQYRFDDSPLNTFFLTFLLPI